VVYQELFALDFKFVGASQAKATKAIGKPAAKPAFIA
jgi:hypothetical protein